MNKCVTVETKQQTKAGKIRVTNNIDDGFMFNTKLCQCDSEPACTPPGL